DKRDIRPSFCNTSDSAGRNFCLAADYQIALPINKIGESFANERVIVNDKNPPFAHTGDRRVRVHIVKLDSLWFGILNLQVATVPLPPFRWTLNVAPISAAPWRIKRSPSPFESDSLSWIPTPLSMIV